ncbi:MAG: non-homologous end-joining DNA ligase [Acidimicrobiales bacterium]|nr:non-homologous end-joining DNA ligase [Acidimicrobiales bacterium]
MTPDVDVEGRRLRLTNLDKVLYPTAGVTKGEVIRYYARVAPVIVPHLHGRCVTMRRFPDGVDGSSFFNKRCPSFRPDWMRVAVGPGGERDDEPVEYCLVDDAAGLVWMANLAAIELHTPMALAADLGAPRAVVFDLDPGAPADVIDCARVALWIRDLLAGVGLVGFAKTSGSKGLQVYVPLNAPATHDQTSAFAYAVARVLERAHPDRVTVSMKKAERPGRVFVDWSQNARHKTTVCVYSARARERPTVSTPVSWAEVDAALTAGDRRLLTFELQAVEERIDRLGDLFAPVLELEQALPGPAAGRP